MMMVRRGLSWGAVFMTGALLLVLPAHSSPSTDSEAGRKYTVAVQRLAELKKSKKQRKYRSYWLDCARTFDLIEKKYPSSPSAGDACYERAELYLDLYRAAGNRRDIKESLQLHTRCQATYPKHEKAPEALARIIDIDLDYRKDRTAANRTFDRLAELYPGSTWTGGARARLGIHAKSQQQEPKLRKPPVTASSSPKTPLQKGAVKDIRHWSGGAYTRIVIDLDKPFTFQAHELKDPDRLCFDLKKASIAGSLKNDPMPINDGILKQVRASQFDTDTVRVVLDLASLQSYVAFPLHNPERLVIDVNGEAEGTASASSQKTPAAQGNTDESGQTQPPQKPHTDAGDGEKLSLSRQMGLKVNTIAIDAGHGGHDPGAIGKNGLKEKAITLDIAKRLAALVKERLGCKVIMTRDRDVYVGLEDRPAIAKTRGADLFVSIHVNANRKRKTRGIETYIQSLTASDRDAMATAARENAMSTKKLSQLKSELDRIFAALDRDNKLEESQKLANVVQGSLVDNLKAVNRHAADLKARVKQAFFYVLINTEMPSILAEVGFISNPDEETLLRRDSYRQSIAEALFQGIKKYVDGRSPQTASL